MTTRKWYRAAAAVAALSLVAAACGGDDDAEDVADSLVDDADSAADDVGDVVDSVVDEVDDAIDDLACDTPDQVSLQLQWSTQAQFAGYYAADSLGFYNDQCLDVTLVEGGVEIVPQTQLANGDADFAIAWVSKALATREAGADIVDIAQVFGRSGTLQISFVDAGITTPADFAGKKIGNWGFGNEYEVFAALGKAGLNPATDVELVGQQFDMVALLDGSIDAAEAMTYNEYAQVLETVNPDTGELYQPEEFNVVNYTEEGVGMLQDAIWADAGRLADDAEYRDIAIRFVAASLQGWGHCRDNVQDCADIVLAAGPQLGASHQLWQMNEINKLIWPAADGVGRINADDWAQTVELSLNTPNLEGSTVLTEDPGDGAYTNDIVDAALEILGSDFDPTGSGYAPIDVTLNEGGN